MATDLPPDPEGVEFNPCGTPYLDAYGALPRAIKLIPRRDRKSVQGPKGFTECRSGVANLARELVDYLA